MIRVPCLVVLVLATLIVAPAKAGEREPEHCERLLSILEVAAQQRIQGDFSNKVEIALEAYERLRCDREGLLEVLKIRVPKKKAKTK